MIKSWLPLPSRYTAKWGAIHPGLPPTGSYTAVSLSPAGHTRVSISISIPLGTVLMGNNTLEELVLDRPLIKSASEEVATHMAALIQYNKGLRRP